MRPSLRFLMVAVLGWTGVRAASFGVLPGAELFRIERSEAKVPPLAATQFPAIQPVEHAPFEPPPIGPMPQAAGAPQPVMVPVYYAAAASVPSGIAGSGRFAGVLPEPRPQFYSPIPALDEWPLSRIAATSMPPMRSTVAAPAQSVPLVEPNRIDRLQLSTWALLRNRQGGLAAGPTSLANGGTLGASQAGARLTYNVTRQIAATLRTSSEVGRRGGEVAAGVRVPLSGLPVWLTAERRQRLGRYGGGRNAFAVFLEGGVYQRPMPWKFSLDAYLQGGVVGMHRRDHFVDGALTLTRPVYRQFSAGFGVWGGAQPGVYRIDAGPRVSMRVRNNVRVHFDWRQRLAGNAQPGSGPAVTLAGDF